ncbi:hypothetical protein DFP78_103256 [Photobacterium lutimaris]|nr:hypothetical protein DFP78_103256 [Photobacterium lutimaris]
MFCWVERYVQIFIESLSLLFTRCDNPIGHKGYKLPPIVGCIINCDVDLVGLGTFPFRLTECDPGVFLIT